MTPAQSLLKRGLVKLEGQLPETFTIPSYPGVTFLGLIDQTSWSNQLGEGGFLPEARGEIAVRVEEFAKVFLTPWPGLKLVVMGRPFVVTDVGRAFNKWMLRLEQSHPKPTDLPTVTRVVGTSAGPPIESTSANQIELSEPEV